jgi:N-acetylneuraminic acid mutarotase
MASPSKKVKVTPFPFFSLPEEMSLNILSFLSAEDMCSVSRTCKELRRFSNENMLWRKLCKRQGWAVPRPVVAESKFFDFQKYYSEKASLSKPGSMQWSEPIKAQGNVPSKRFKHTATVVGKYVIVIGGQETDTKRFNDILYYDTETNTFSQPTIKGDKVPAFSRHTSCLINGKLVIFGGFDGHGTNYNLALFDPNTRIWTQVPQSVLRGTIPPSRTNHAAASVGSKMYIFGGNNNNDHGAYQVLDDLYVLDTDSMTWTRPQTTGDKPSARSGHTLTAIGTKLYLFGGGVWNEDEGWVHKHNDIHVLDTETMHWTRPVTTGAAETSTFPIAWALGGYLFIFGGGSKIQHCVTNDLYVLDIATMHWSSPDVKGDRPHPRDMGSAAMVGVGRNVYLLGGYAGGAVDYFEKLTFDAVPLRNLCVPSSKSMC